MKLTKAQFSTLSDICREAATVVLGSLLIGALLAQDFKLGIAILGLVLYPIGIALALYFKKKGE
jgi:hypothetical protein